MWVKYHRIMLTICALFVASIAIGEELKPISPKPDLSEPEFVKLKKVWDTKLKEKYHSLPEDEKPNNETQWCKFLAPKYEAVVEFRLLDNTRVDLLNRKYAFEVDWANKSLKWAEAIGQAGWYAHNTRRKPAVFLLVPDKKEGTMKNVYRCRAVCELYKIPVFIEDLTKYTNP